MPLMQMFPEEVDPATSSEAERTLFRRLKLVDSPDWVYAVHSLNLAEHSWKRAGEIDFLLVGPKGIFVLEVKGGRVQSERGMWRYTNRYGRSTVKRGSPFAQASSAMFSLQARLEELVDRRLVDHTTFGYAVVFPDQDFGMDSVEWADEMVIDRTQLDRQDGVLRSLNRLASYWRAKPGQRDRVLTPANIEQYRDALRPDYDVVPTLQRVAQVAEQELAVLTSRQYAALDAHNRNDRILYEGGAGTGKTMLAAELCRRRARVGEQVLFTCHSPIVADYVSRQPGLEEVTAVPMATLDEAGPKFDVLVVDEAQDVMNVEQLLILESRLRGGFQNGRWYLFLDSNNQRGLIGAYEPDGVAHIQAARPAVFDLSDNCRNTATIVSEVTTLTGADVGVSTAGTGPAVELITTDGLKTAGKEAGKILDRLTDGGVTADQIMLLSPFPLSASAFSRMPAKWQQRIEGLDVRSWFDRPQTRLGFATVADFKGLESPFVILCDVNLPDGSDQQPPSELYVGMTRARVGLSVVARQLAHPDAESKEPT
jgi:hypothetical protein